MGSLRPSCHQLLGTLREDTVSVETGKAGRPARSPSLRHMEKAVTLRPPPRVPLTDAADAGAEGNPYSVACVISAPPVTVSPEFQSPLWLWLWPQGFAYSRGSMHSFPDRPPGQSEGPGARRSFKKKFKIRLWREWQSKEREKGKTHACRPKQEDGRQALDTSV